MKTFKDFIAMNEAKDNFLTPDEIKKLKAHYDDNPGLRSISQSIKDFESDHEAFVKLKGNVDKSVKDNMIKTSARLRKMGIEDGVLTEDKDFIAMNEKASVKKGFGLKVGDVILYGREGTPHEVTDKPKPYGSIYSVDVLNLSSKKKDKIYFDNSDIFIMAEKDSLDEAGYVVTVAVRDARAANELAKDSYRNLYKNDGSDVFVFKKESDKEDFENDLLDMGLEVLKEEVEINEAKMYKSEYLSDSDVSYIMQAVGVSWRDFEKRVKDAIQQYLKMLLGDVQRVTVIRANIGGYMFSHGGSVRLLVNEILYEFREDGESYQSVIKKQEIWVNL